MKKGQKVFFIRPYAEKVEEGLYLPRPMMLTGVVTGHTVTGLDFDTWHVVTVEDRTYTLTSAYTYASPELPKNLIKCFSCAGWGQFITSVKWVRDALLNGQTLEPPKFTTYEPAECVTCETSGFYEYGKNDRFEGYPETEEDWNRMSPSYRRVQWEAAGDGTRGAPFQGMVVKEEKSA